MGLGRNFGILSIVLSVCMTLGMGLAPSGVWVRLAPLPLLFAGFAGFLKKTAFPAVATIITTLFLLWSGSLTDYFKIDIPFLVQEEPGPPPLLPPKLTPEEIQEMLNSLPPPTPPSFFERFFDLLDPLLALPFILLSFFMEDHPKPTLIILYLFAIMGIFWSTTQNHHHKFLKKPQL
jgi:hypothetical protein